jgi:hypothetical protein
MQYISQPVVTKADILRIYDTVHVGWNARIE